jgi:hypothetical protein
MNEGIDDDGVGFLFKLLRSFDEELVDVVAVLRLRPLFDFGIPIPVAAAVEGLNNKLLKLEYMLLVLLLPLPLLTVLELEVTPIPLLLVPEPPNISPQFMQWSR